MEETVQKRMEAFETAMREIRESKVFTEEELNKFTNKVELHERKMAGPKPCQDDYKASIKYEEGVYWELMRRKKIKALQNVDHLEWIFIKRIMTTYRRGLKHFFTDFNFNLAFFDFVKYLPEAHLHTKQKHVSKMLRVFEHNPEVFRQTAAWYFHCGKNDDARRILLRGQYLHPQNLEIYLDLIEIEIKNINDKRNQNRLKTYIDAVVKAGITYRFLEEVIKIFTGLANLKEVIDFAIEQLLLAYGDEPGVWTFVALRELKGDYHPSGSEHKQSSLYSIERARKRFKDGIAIVPQDKQADLWKTYLDTMLNVKNEYKNAHTLSALRDTLEEAAEADIDIDETHYFAWFDCCLNNSTLIIKKLEEGIKKHPSSIIIWSIYLKYYVREDKWESAKQVFERAVDALGPRSAKIWQAYIDYLMLSSPARDIDALYEKAIIQPHEELAKLFKIRYLEWVLLSRGVEVGRQLYLRIARRPPYNKNLHSHMLVSDSMDDIQTVTTPLQEEIFKCWMEQFGTEDPVVYSERIKQIRTLGGPDVNEKVSAVYEEAIRTLSDDTKISQFKKLFENPK